VILWFPFAFAWYISLAWAHILATLYPRPEPLTPLADAMREAEAALD